MTKQQIEKMKYDNILKLSLEKNKKGIATGDALKAQAVLYGDPIYASNVCPPEVCSGKM